MSQGICVYLGARGGKGEQWADAASTAGRLIARQGCDVIYGGGRLGLMGKLADSALDAGGRVIGVIPKKLIALEQAHPNLHQQFIVESMHERKAKLTELADAFLILPGGFGTLDELFEAITWRQLEFHTKPIAIWNVEGYYDGLWAFLQQGRRLGFMPETTFTSIHFDSDLEPLLTLLH